VVYVMSVSNYKLVSNNFGKIYKSKVKAYYVFELKWLTGFSSELWVHEFEMPWPQGDIIFNNVFSAPI